MLIGLIMNKSFVLIGCDLVTSCDESDLEIRAGHCWDLGSANQSKQNITNVK